MKKLLTALGVMIWCMLQAQQINRVEYYINTDPGYGNAIALPITAGDSVSGIFSIPTNSLTPGMHVIHVRALDASNQWSVFSKKTIHIQTPPPVQIVAAEYFIGNDPGIGNGTPITVTAGDSIDLVFAVPTSSLSTGTHEVYARTKDALGHWSVFSKKTFFVQTPNPVSIIAAEYFVDTDPGFGNATALSVTPGDSIDLNFNVPTTGLSDGLHFIHVRTQTSDGKWSVYSKKYFYVYPEPAGEVVAAEYFVDTDPGFGNGTSLTVTAGDSIQSNFDIATGTLSHGFHQIFVRTLDSKGKWSVHSRKQIYVYPEPKQIVYAEYHVDNLGAYGTGTSLNITPGDSVLQTFQVPTNLLTLGPHKIYVTVKDAANNWSVFSKDSFYVDAFNCAIYNNGEIELLGDTCKGSQIIFNDLVTNNTGENTNDFTREWDFFDDGTVDFSGESVNYTFNQTGTFTVKLRTYLTANPFCSETVYKTFTIRNIDTTNLSVSICDGQSHFAGGANQTTQGIYYDVKPNRWGCDSVIVTNLTVTPNVTPSVSIVASQTSFCSGSYVQFDATPVNGGQYPYYQWRVNGNLVAQGYGYQGYSSYGTYGLANNDVVTVDMTSYETCTTVNPSTSNSIQVSVTPSVSAAITISVDNNNFCAGNSANFSVTNTTNQGSNPQYSWYINNVLQAETGTTLSRNNFSGGEQVRCYLTSDATCVNNSPVSSNVITMTVFPNGAPDVSISRNTNNICFGTQVVFTAFNSYGGSNPNYQWFLNGVLVQNGASNQYISTTLDNEDSIAAVLTSDYQCRTANYDTSNSYIMDVFYSTPVTVSLSANDNDICDGQTVSFTATPSPFYGGETYTWYKNNQVVQSGTNRFYTSSSLADRDSVWVILSSTPLPCATGVPAKSDTVHFKVTPNVTVAVSIVESANNICAGTNVTFTATPTNPGVSPTYSWYVNNVYQQSFTSNTFASTGLGNGSTVTAYLTSSIECALNNPAQSNRVVMNVTSVLLPEVSISTPVTTICEGTEVSFTATVSNQGNNPTIEWLINNALVQTGGLTFTSEDLENLNNIKVRLTSDYTCPQTNPVLSNQIQMTVFDSVTPTVFLSYGPNPACVGNLITLFATPSFPGSNPIYTFYKNGNIVQSGIQSQYTSSNFNDGDEVYVVLESDANCARTTTATSNTENISIVQFAQASVSIQATTAQCVGSSITFTATGQSAGSNPVYTWKVNNIVLQSNGSNTFNTNAVNNGDVVVCEMNSSLGCVSNNPAISNSITVQFNSVVTPSVDLAANVNNVCQGTNIVFTATPVNGGTTPNYIFRRNNNIVQNSSSNIYSTANLLNGDVVSVEMTSSEGCVSVNPVSDNVTVILNQCSQASVGLSTVASICEGDNITLTAIPTNGGQDPNYEFFVDGNSVYSGSSNQYVIQNAQAGSYSAYVIMTSSEQNVTNNPATSNTVQVLVNEVVVPTVSIAPSQNNVCQTQYITFTATSSNAGNNPSYTWYVNGALVQNYNQPELGGAFGVSDTVTVIMSSSATCAQPNSVAAGYRLNLIAAVTPSVDLVASTNNICPGTPITFTATPTNGGNNPSYNFYVNNQPVQSSYSNTFTSSTLQHNDVVTVEMNADGNCLAAVLAYDNVTVLLTQCQPVEVSLSVSSNSVCVGNDVTLTAFPTNGGQTPNYEFFVNGFSVYSGSQNQFTINASQAGVYSAYVVLTSSEQNVTNNPATSNIVQVTVNNIVVPTVTVFASANNVCESQYITLTTNVTNGGTSSSYAWYINGNFVQNFNQPELSGYFNDDDTVTVVFTSNAVCAQPATVTSGFRFNLIPDVTPGVSIVADNNNFCYGTTVTFTATPVNGGNSPEYAWYVDGTLVQTGISNTYTSSLLNNGDDVYVVITSSETCVTNSTAVSNAIAMNVIYYQTPGVSISNNYGNTVCLNDVVTYTAFPSNGGANPTYEWFLNGFSVQNSSSNELIVPAAQAGFYEVYVVLTSDYPCLQTVTATSSTATLTVSTALTPDISIVSNTTEICPGGTVFFEVRTTLNGGLTPAYQWLVNNSPVNGAQGTTFSSNNLQDGDVVSCELTSSFSCAVNNPVISNAIQIEVTQNAVASVSLTVNNNPFCEASSSVTFFANAVNGGNAPDYEWYLNGNLVYSGINAFSYVLNNPANEDSMYVYMFSNDACVAQQVREVYSNGIELQELPTVPVSASIVATVNNVCPGEAVSFVTTPINGGTNVSYVWNVNGQDVQLNNNATYTAVLNNGDNVYVKVFSSENCPSHYPAVSNTVSVITNSSNCANQVSVAINTSINTVCAGSSVTFTTTAANEGATPNYNWYVNGTNVQNGSNSQLTYTFNSSGQYSVYVVLTSSESNVGNNPATSNMSMIIVNELLTPAVTLAANSNNICLNESVTFTASAINGGNNPVFNWYVNGNLQQSGSNNVLTTTTLNNGDVVYVTMASSIACVTAQNVTSNSIAVQVNQLSAPTVQVVANPGILVCPNTVVSYSATGTNTGSNPIFNWHVNGSLVSSGLSYQYTPSNGDSVSVLMTSNSICATVPTAVSHVKMTVDLILQTSVSVSASNAGIICGNDSKIIVATPVNGGNNPQYQWQVNGVNAGSVSGSNTFNASALQTGDQVSVILTSNNACVSNAVVNSNTIRIERMPYLEPDVVINPSAYDVCEGSAVTYTAVPINGGNAPIYQWFLNDVLVSTGLVYSYVPQADDTVSVIMTTSYECPLEPTSSNSIAPTIQPLPLASFTVDIDTAKTVSFYNQTNTGTVYVWLFGDGTVENNISNPIHVYANGGYYTVTLLAINSCGTDTMTQVVAIEPLPPTGIADNEILFESVTLFPNPAERFVNINLELLQSSELELTWHDALGRIVYAERMNAFKGSNTQRFDMSSFAKGVYTLNIRNEQYSVTKRLVLQ